MHDLTWNKLLFDIESEQIGQNGGKKDNYSKSKDSLNFDHYNQIKNQEKIIP